MNAFPETFTFAAVEEVIKKNSEERVIQIQTLVQKGFYQMKKKYLEHITINCVGSDTTDCIETLSIKEVNKIIKYIRTELFKDDEGYCISIRSYSDDNGKLIKKFSGIQIYNNDSINGELFKYNSETKNYFRKTIYNEIMENYENAESFSIALVKRIHTKSFETIGDELNNLGWDVTVYDLWDDINDDFSVITITLSKAK